MDWILVVYIYAGALASGNSEALTQVTGFTNKEVCIAAGEQLKPLVKGSAKDLRFICVQAR